MNLLTGIGVVALVVLVIAFTLLGEWAIKNLMRQSRKARDVLPATQLRSPPPTKTGCDLCDAGFVADKTATHWMGIDYERAVKCTARS
jgi:hypothetical protein